MLKNLSKDIKNILIENGANLVGFADLQKIAIPFDKSIKSGVSIAVSLNPGIIKKIIEYPTIEYYEEYKRVNNLLSKLGKTATKYLKQKYYSVIELKPSGGIRGLIDLSTPLPHKTVATRAGMGWIGKTALLITKPYGSAVRFTTILTDAKLDTASETFDSSECGDCRICVEECPGQAATGKDWNIKMKRKDFFDAYICRDTALKRASMVGIGAHSICGKCIAVCPWTKKYLKRAV